MASKPGNAVIWSIYLLRQTSNPSERVHQRSITFVGGGWSKDEQSEVVLSMDFLSLEKQDGGAVEWLFPGWGTPRWVNRVSWFACASIRSEPMATASASLNPYSFLSFGSIRVSKKEDYYLVRYRRTNRMLLGNSLVSFCINEWKDWKCNGNCRIPAFISSSNLFPRN